MDICYGTSAPRAYARQFQYKRARRAYTSTSAPGALVLGNWGISARRAYACTHFWYKRACTLVQARLESPGHFHAPTRRGCPRIGHRGEREVKMSLSPPQSSGEWGWGGMASGVEDQLFMNSLDTLAFTWNHAHTPPGHFVIGAYILTCFSSWGVEVYYKLVPTLAYVNVSVSLFAFLG